MTMVYSEEQRQLADTAREFLAAKSPVSALRRLRDEKPAAGFDAALWQEFAEMGWTAIPFPEALGGLEFGCKGLGPVFEEIGRTLCASPMLSSVVLAGTVLQFAGSAEQQERLLPDLISGSKRLALAIDERPRHDPASIGLRAELDGDDYRLSGEKCFVIDGVDADSWIVVGRLPDGQVALFVVEAGSEGLSVVPTPLIDSHNHARLRLIEVRVSASNRLLQGNVADALDLALDRARACLAAEMLGASQIAFDTTVEYLKTRVQFDAPIGSFQALQHRAAWCYVHLALARSAVMGALSALDDDKTSAAERSRLVSLAKWKAGEVAQRVSNEAIQMHGGIGVTDELDIGLYMKRIRVAQACLGDADFLVASYDKSSVLPAHAG